MSVQFLYYPRNRQTLSWYFTFSGKSSRLLANSRNYAADELCCRCLTTLAGRDRVTGLKIGRFLLTACGEVGDFAYGAGTKSFEIGCL